MLFIVYFFILAKLFISQSAININTTINVNTSIQTFPTYQYFYINMLELSIFDQFINIQYSPIAFQQYVESYMQISLTQMISPTPISIGNMTNDLYIDKQGYSINSRQFISIPVQKLKTVNQQIYVYIFFLSRFSNQFIGTFLYNLTVSSGTISKCPNNCSQNGICISGKCLCQYNRFGYDCSVHPSQLSLTTNMNFISFPFIYTYYRIIENQLNKQIHVSIQCDQQGSKNLSIFVAKQNSTRLVSRFFYQKLYHLNESNKIIEFDISLNNSLWVLILNNKYPIKLAITVTVVHSENSSASIITHLFVVISVCALGVVSYYLYKKFLETNKSNVEQRQNLSKLELLSIDDLQECFPSLVLEELNQIIQPQLYDQICIVCLANYLEDDIVTVAYCTHLYHRACLRTWLQKQKNCPCCRINFDKSLIQLINPELVIVQSCNMSSILMKIFESKRQCLGKNHRRKDSTVELFNTSEMEQL